MPKSKYETHVEPYIDKIAAWAQAGATAKAIAEKLGIAYSSFRSYLDRGEKGDERYLALSAAFTRACAMPDDNIETALYDRARGIEWEEKTFERVKDKATGEYEEIMTKRVTKYTPPDVTSAMFWLSNRRPERWKYRPEARTDDEGESGGIVMLAEVMEAPELPAPAESTENGAGGDG